MGPILWLYISWLTAEQPWTFKRKHILHFVPAGLALIAVSMSIIFSLNTGEPRVADTSYHLVLLHRLIMPPILVLFYFCYSNPLITCFASFIVSRPIAFV